MGKNSNTVSKDSRDVNMKKRYTRENDIVVNHEHGLMWQDDDSVNNSIDWNQANAMASQLRLGSYNDWRLPSLDELLSIANKNNVPQLDNIFINRPSSTWSALESENKQTAWTVYYDNKNICYSMFPSDDRKDSKLFVRYVRDIEKINNSDYETDINNLTCTCKNWKLLRSQFPIDDPRRLCKHLIKKIDIDNMDSNLNRYKYEIKFYKNKNSGFPDDFNTLIDIEGTSHKLLYKHQNQSWMNFFDSDGTKYGVMHENYERVVWTHLYGKPEDYEKVEKYFNQLTVKLPLWLQEYEKNELIHYMKTVISGKANSHFSIMLHQYVPSPSEIYYSVGEDNDNIRNIIDNEIYMLVVKKDVMIIEMYGGKKYHIARDCEKLKLIEEKKLIIENDSVRYVCPQEKNLQQYGTLNSLLKEINAAISVRKFNTILEKIGMLTKVEGLNNSGWILINNGLEYGMNLVQYNTDKTHSVIPDWYVMVDFDYDSLTFTRVTQEMMKITGILWKKDKFSELLILVMDNMDLKKEETKKIVTKVSGISKKQAERDEWLQFVECSNCASKNIHKKNKRTYGYGEVQRYQCMDCKKIFQELINKKSNDDVTE